MVGHRPFASMQLSFTACTPPFAEALFGAQVLKVSTAPTVSPSLFQELVVESAGGPADAPKDAASQHTLAILKALEVCSFTRKFV